MLLSSNTTAVLVLSVALLGAPTASALCDFEIGHAVASDVSNNIDIGLEGSCAAGQSTLLRSQVTFPVIGPGGKPVVNFWERVVRHGEALPRLITIDYPFHSPTNDPMPRGKSVKIDLFQENAKVDSRILVIN